MKCSRAQKSINDHIDCKLNRKQIEDLERHLEACGSCRKLLTDMESIVSEAKRLERVSPSTDLWSTIKVRVTGRPGKGAFKLARKNQFSDFFRFQKPFVFAVSTMLAAIILTGLFYRDLPLLESMRIFSGKPDPQNIAFTHLKEAERHYRIAIAQLSGDISEKQGDMDPELTEVLEENMEIIDNSILACLDAVNRHPENIDAKLYLLASYRKKIELLNEIKRISMQIG